MPNPAAITLAERQSRLAALRTLMDAGGIKAVLLGATASLRYFTGLIWHASERLCGAIVHADGRLEYVCPAFEREKVAGIVGVPGEILTWEEHENPYALVAGRLGTADRLAVDDQIALFMFLGLRRAMGDERLADAGPLVGRLRRRKSPAEIALMTRAKAITIEVHRRAWQSLTPGVLASEVTHFIDQQHRVLNGGTGSSFCIVSFGEDTSLPHGGETDRALSQGDVVLIDTGTTLDGYNSDITRTYVFGEAGPHVRRIWEIEKEAQGAAFAAAALGRPCESVDDAARAVLVRHGLGPDYQLPGTPHRTGHGIGLDIHEVPNLVRGDATPLEVGMCFSNEPMIVVPGAFGIRLEDHFHMTADGPKWFTKPQFSLDDPFGDVGDFQP
ncbi:MAG: Xaa-Pro peptidase family protein [Caulobacter sp.]|nr:Xaa-Pro peptidase family protein [Caulobacter sp.]